MIITPHKKKIICFCYIDFVNCTLTLPIVTVLSSDQTRYPAVPDLFIDPVGIRALQMWNKALSCQHSTLYRLQNTIGLVGCSGLFVSVKALSVYRKYCTTALCQRATIRVAKSAFIGMNARNPQTEDRLGKRKQREKVCANRYLTVTQIIKQQQAFIIWRCTLSRK